MEEFALGEFINMGFPITYESRFQTELHQLLVHYEENKWIWYRRSMAHKPNGLRIRTHKDFPGEEDIFNKRGNAYSLVHHQGSMSDPDDYQFIISKDVTKNRINDLVAEIEKSGENYLAE